MKKWQFEKCPNSMWRILICSSKSIHQRGRGRLGYSLEIEALMDSSFVLSLCLAKLGRHLFFFFSGGYHLYPPTYGHHLDAFLLSCLSWQPPSFPSLGDGEVCHLHILSLPCTTVLISSQRGTFVHIWYHSFCGCHSGDTPWSPSSSGLVFLGPMTIGKWVLGRLQPPKALQKQQDKTYPPVFL